MMLSACFAHNVLPVMQPDPTTSPHQRWFGTMPRLSALVASPGDLVHYVLTSGMSQVRSFGIFVLATSCAHQVFDLESRALLVVPFMDLDVSPFIELVLRSSSITAATFGGLCPEESSSMFGVPHWCGDSLALVTASLSHARAASVNGGLARERWTGSSPCGRPGL
jgi:hypothetical protein